MRRSSLALGAALAIALVHLALRSLGLGAHMSVVAGTPVDASSAVLAPIYLASYLLAVTAAPILLIAGLLERLITGIDPRRARVAHGMRDPRRAG